MKKTLMKRLAVGLILAACLGQSAVYARWFWDRPSDAEITGDPSQSHRRNKIWDKPSRIEREADQQEFQDEKPAKKRKAKKRKAKKRKAKKRKSKSEKKQSRKKQSRKQNKKSVGKKYQQADENKQYYADDLD